MSILCVCGCHRPLGLGSGTRQSSLPNTLCVPASYPVGKHDNINWLCISRETGPGYEILTLRLFVAKRCGISLLRSDAMPGPSAVRFASMFHVGLREPAWGDDPEGPGRVIAHEVNQPISGDRPNLKRCATGAFAGTTKYRRICVRIIVKLKSRIQGQIFLGRCKCLSVCLLEKADVAGTGSVIGVGRNTKESKLCNLTTFATRD